MSDEQAILEYVRLKGHERWDAIRDAAEVKADQIRNSSARSNMSLSGGLLQGILDIWDVALREWLGTRIQIEQDVRHRYGQRLQSPDGDRIFAELTSTIEAATGDHGAVTQRTRQWADPGKQQAKRVGEKFVAYAKQQVRLALMEAAMPEPAIAPAIANVVHVNAPVYVDVVARIDRLNVGTSSDDLKEALKEVLESVRELPDEKNSEVREIVDAVVVETQRGAEANKGLLRNAFRRLNELSTAVESTTKITAAVGKVIGILRAAGVI